MPTYSDEAMIGALREFLSQHPDPRAAFAASIRTYVEANLTLDGMIREFGKVDAFIRAHLPR